MMTQGALAPCMLWLVASALCWAPTLGHPRGPGLWHAAASSLLLGGALLTDHPAAASCLLAVTAGLHAWEAFPVSRTSAFGQLLAALLMLVVAGATQFGELGIAFVASVAAIAVSAGAMPLHVGVASLATRLPAAQIRAFATVIVLVWIHVLYLDQIPLAYAAAPMIVRVGAIATMIPALIALVARNTSDLYRATVVAHGGILLMAVGAAGHGHYAAALFAALTMGLAMGGLGLTVAALEARAGDVSLAALGGRVRAFPALAASFAIFAAAGVGLPGTAGFIADDLLLHAVWEESGTAAAVLIMATATLAVAMLNGYARIFLGPPTTSAAPDLLPRERRTVVALLLVLVVLGVVPQLFVTPASAVLGTVP